MKILVTGGAGFIGSHIVDAYIKQGDDVAIVDDLSSGRRENINPEARFFEADIRSSDLGKIFQEVKPDLVNHQAAQVNVRRSVADPVFDARVNIEGSLNVFENSVKFNVGKIVFASSGGAIYGEQRVFPADETHSLEPVSPYGVSKLAVEKYIYYYRMSHALDYTILRYANVYGPRQDPFGEAGVVAIFSNKLLSGEDAVINGDGKQTRDFVYVSDVVGANLLSGKEGSRGVFNIGTSNETDINTMFARIAGITGSNAKDIHGIEQPGEQKRSVISCALAKDVLGWKPEVSLEEGLRSTVEFFKQKKK